MKTSFENKLTLHFILISIGIVVIGIISYQSNMASKNNRNWVIHTHQVLFESEQVLSVIKDVQIATRGYALTKDASFSRTVKNFKPLIFKYVAKLQDLTSDNTKQQTRIEKLKRLINQRAALSLNIINKTDNHAFKLIATLEGEKLMHEIRDVIDEIQAEENRLLVIRNNANQESEKLLNICFYILLIAAGISLILGFFIIKRYVAYKKVTVEAIKRLNNGLEQRVIEKTGEIMEKEQRYHFVLNIMQEGIQIIDYDWKYLYVNEALTKQALFSSDELLGNTMMIKYPGIENTDLFKVLKKCMKERIADRIENEFTYANGEKGYYDLIIQPVPEGIFIMSIDISDRKKREKEKEQYTSELESVLFKISHEVRHPVVQLLGVSGLLETSLDTDEDTQMLIISMKQSAILLDNYTRDLSKFVTGMKSTSQN